MGVLGQEIVISTWIMILLFLVVRLADSLTDSLTHSLSLTHTRTHTHTHKDTYSLTQKYFQLTNHLIFRTGHSYRILFQVVAEESSAISCIISFVLFVRHDPKLVSIQERSSHRMSQKRIEQQCIRCDWPPRADNLPFPPLSHTKAIAFLLLKDQTFYECQTLKEMDICMVNGAARWEVLLKFVSWLQNCLHSMFIFLVTYRCLAPLSPLLKRRLEFRVLCRAMETSLQKECLHIITTVKWKKGKKPEVV